MNPLYENGQPSGTSGLIGKGAAPTWLATSMYYNNLPSFTVTHPSNGAVYEAKWDADLSSYEVIRIIKEPTNPLTEYNPLYVNGTEGGTLIEGGNSRYWKYAGYENDKQMPVYFVTNPKTGMAYTAERVAIMGNFVYRVVESKQEGAQEVATLKEPLNSRKLPDTTNFNWNPIETDYAKERFVYAVKPKAKMDARRWRVEKFGVNGSWKATLTTEPPMPVADKDKARKLPIMPYEVACNNGGYGYAAPHQARISGEKIRDFAKEKLGMGVLAELPEIAPSVVEIPIEKLVIVGAVGTVGEDEQAMLVSALQREQHVQNDRVKRAFEADDKEGTFTALADLRLTLDLMERLGVEPEPWQDNTLALMESALADRVPARKESITCPAPRSHTRRWHRLVGRKRSLSFSARRFA